MVYSKIKYYNLLLRDSTLKILLQIHYFFKSGLEKTLIVDYVSQFTVETYCFADGRCLFKQPQSVIYHWNQYDEEVSKKCRSVRLSICNANKKAYSSIIDSRKIIRISGERAYHPLQEKEEIFSKNIFQKF